MEKPDLADWSSKMSQYYFDQQRNVQSNRPSKDSCHVRRLIYNHVNNSKWHKQGNMGSKMEMINKYQNWSYILIFHLEIVWFFGVIANKKKLQRVKWSSLWLIIYAALFPKNNQQNCYKLNAFSFLTYSIILIQVKIYTF